MSRQGQSTGFFIYPCLILISGLYASLAHCNDDYLEGYLSSILVQQLGWHADSFRIEVSESVATITVDSLQQEAIETATRAFAEVPQLIDFNFVSASDSEPVLPGVIHYPRGDYFRPIIADVKEPQFHMALNQTKFDGESIVVADVGLGHSFGLFRWPVSSSGNGWQLSFFGALFSQFNMDTSSDDLLNTDYLVGFPLTLRYGNFSGRFRLVHLSSHLGDELLLSDQAPERINLSIEAIDMMLAYDIGYWRGMLGGAKLIRHDPTDLEDRIFTAGIDYRNPVPIIGNSRFIAGIYTEWMEEINWNSGTSLKFGLEFGQSYPERHGVRLMVHAYKGFSPYGQFFVSNVEYYGLGMYFDFF